MNAKVIKKIKALLAIADAKKNDCENERATALRQATKLMDEHSISEVDLNQQEDPRGAGHAETKTSRWKAKAIYYISKLYGCDCYRTTGRNGRTYVIGKLSHRTTVLAMGEYVINSIEREAKKFKGAGKAYITSFKVGAADGVHFQVNELLEARKQGETTSTSKALAVVNHYELEKQANKQWLKDQGIELRSAGRSKLSDGNAYAQGTRYGRSLSLRNQVEGNSNQKRLSNA